MPSITWPALAFSEWQDTCATLHMWTQVVGKIRLAQTPLVNHWWNVPLYVSARGLTTTAMPYDQRSFEMEFDFIDHQLQIRCDNGSDASISLVPRSVADFYREVMAALHGLGLNVRIWPVPVEVPDAIPFEHDNKHKSYNPEHANRFWRILVQVDRVFREFRAGFIGKSSPVHFFWGSFDLAVTRFSGRRAPERPGADPVTREAYSHEVISHGFWPGGGAIKGPAFYSYAAPEPTGFSQATVRPDAAYYHPEMKEFLLLYDDARNTHSPEETIKQFLESTYQAGATLANWDRSMLERGRTKHT